MYVYLRAIKEGFIRSCRKFFGFDGCFLSSRDSGQLLYAIGQDANNGIYLVSYAVIGKECKESKKWFF